MKRLGLVALAGLAFACKSEAGVGAPVVDGSWMVFKVSDSTPMGSIDFDLKLGFKQRGEVFDITFEHNGSDPKVAPISVNRQLVPEDNVIGAFSLGRLWLPPEGRERTKRTPCGPVTKEQKYKDWQVFKVDGLCGTAHGSRFYEKTTGMLVGFIFSGGTDRSAYVRESG